MLEIIAMVTMLIDHIGVIFFPEQELWRIIGRIAFPIYAFFIVQGYSHTKNLKRYSIRLLVLALICHIPVLFGLDFGVYNVIFTLFLGLMALLLLDKKISIFLKFIGLSFILAVSIVVPIDYGLYGILTILMYHCFKGHLLLLVHIVFNAVFIYFDMTSNFQWYSLIATVFILFHGKIPKVQVNRIFYRLFYPVHLAVLYGISLMF